MVFDDVVVSAAAAGVTLFTLDARGVGGKQSALLKAEHRVAVPKGEYEAVRGESGRSPRPSS